MTTLNTVYVGKLNILPSYIQAEITLAARVIDTYLAFNNGELAMDQMIQKIREIRSYDSVFKERALEKRSPLLDMYAVIAAKISIDNKEATREEAIQTLMNENTWTREKCEEWLDKY